MATPKLRTQMRAAIGDKVTERLVRLEVSLVNISDTLTQHITAGDASLKAISLQIDNLTRSINALLLKNAVEEGEKLALEKMARSTGALYGTLFGAGVSMMVGLLEFLAR